MAINHLQFVTAVWGKGHTQVFVELGLPSLLSPGNVPGMINHKIYQYHIFTKKSDFEIIEATSAFKYLQKTMPVQISFIEGEFESPHLMMSHCHRLGLQYAYQLNAGVVFIPPDCIWADGSMVNLEKIVAKGVSMVHMSGLRLDRDALSNAMRDFQKNGEDFLQIAPRELIKLGLPHLHPITNDLFFRERSEKLMPANLLWTVENEGILAKCFHLHPLFVKPDKNSEKFKTTIDDDLGLIIDPSVAQDYVVSDSDEIFAFELSPLSHKVTANYRKGSISDIAAWAEVGANDFHRKQVKKTIRIHFSDRTPKVWGIVETEADIVVKKVLKLLKRSLLFLWASRYFSNISHRYMALSLKKEKFYAAGQIVSSSSNYISQIIRKYQYYCRWYAYSAIHHARHYYNWYLFRAKHQVKYRTSRVLHYYNWYLFRAKHQVKYRTSRFLHHVRWYLNRVIHYSSYYAGRVLFHLKLSREAGGEGEN